MKAKGPSNTLTKSANRTGWGFIGLASVLIAVFNLYPVLNAVWTSFLAGKGNHLTFAGVENYRRMLQDVTLHKAFFNTVLYLLVQVPVMLVLGLILASALQDRRLKFKGFFRTALFLPCVTSSVAYALVMKTIFANEGLFNRAMMGIGLMKQPIPWLTDSLWAKVLIIIAITWRWTGYNMVFYVAGLQNIEPSVYEAAELDGAGAFRRMVSITIPLLKPVILFTSITSTVGTLQLFDEVFNITAGGPANATLTISEYVYDLCFKFVPDFGYATAVSVVVVILIAALSMLQFKAGGDEQSA